MVVSRVMQMIAFPNYFNLCCIYMSRLVHLYIVKRLQIKTLMNLRQCLFDLRESMAVTIISISILIAVARFNVCRLHMTYCRRYHPFTRSRLSCYIHIRPPLLPICPMLTSTGHLLYTLGHDPAFVMSDMNAIVQFPKLGDFTLKYANLSQILMRAL